MICYIKSCRFLLVYVANAVANTHCVTSGLRTLEKSFEDVLKLECSVQVFGWGGCQRTLSLYSSRPKAWLHLDVIRFSYHGLRLVVRSYMVFEH